MAIRSKDGTSTEGKPMRVIEIDNGDLQALNDAMKQYGFVSEEALLRYVLVALLESDGNGLYIKKDGNILSIKVSPSLIKQKDADK